jgi:Arc/MetJ family transcription regulator
MAARRTTMNIDHELVAQAQELLHTDNATSTVHAALSRVIRQFRLEQAAELRFPDGFWEETKARRQPRQEWKEWGEAPSDAADAT